MKCNSNDIEGFERRFLPLECINAPIPEGQKNPKIAKEIIEEEGSQIVNWVLSMPLEEARAAIDEGLTSELKRRALNDLDRERWEDIALWLEESWDWENSRGARSGLNYSEERKNEMMANRINAKAKGFWVKAVQAFQAYENWCKSRGRSKYIRKRSNFFEGLEALGATIPRDKDGKISKSPTAAGKRDRLIMLPPEPVDEPIEEVVPVESNGKGHKPEDRLVQIGDRVMDVRDPSRVGEVVGYEPGSSAPIAVLWDEQRGQVDISGQYYPDALRFQNLQLTLMG